MTDWVLVGLITVYLGFLQLIGWKCLKELEAIHQRVSWIQQDVQKKREGS